MINYINNNNIDNNNVKWLGDEVCDDGMRVILSNNVEVFIYENGEMDFYDFESESLGEGRVYIKGDDVRYEESMNWVMNNIIVDDE
jgi:hypothetical protein